MAKTRGNSDYSYLVKAADVPKAGLALTIEPDGAALDAIARSLGVEAMEGLRIDAEVTPWRRMGLRASGKIAGRVRQVCVVTLDPFWNDVETTFEGTFEPAGSPRRKAPDAEIAFDALDSEDPPEPMIDGAADVGALALEFLALAIDPYPRKPGASLEAEMPEGSGDGDDDGSGAFGILGKLK